MTKEAKHPSKVLVTGSAGFIGFHFTLRLLTEGYDVVGLDNLNSYYDPGLKARRLAETGIVSPLPEASFAAGTVADHYPYGELISSGMFPRYRFVRLALEDRGQIAELFRKEQFELVVHLAAQAGVRYSLDNPWAYIDSNITGTLSILEACRHYPVSHLVYASSSSVYGLNSQAPFSVTDFVDHPVSLYAATKKADELMAYTYSHLFHIPVTGLRFFTVYGPWGRPDMAYFSFTGKILNGQPIDVFNHGELWRDFTYVDDIAEGMVRVMAHPPAGNTSSHGDQTGDPYALYNIGNATPVKLTDFIAILEKVLNRKAILRFLDMQPGDVLMTHADVSPLEATFGYRPRTNLQQGLEKFVAWYRANE